MSCIFLGVDAKTPLLAPLRSAIATVVDPLYFVAAAPYLVADDVARALSSRARLTARNAELERELLRLRGEVSRYNDVLTENERLRELFDSQARLADDVMIAELVASSVQALEIVIDKGRLSNVSAGLAVIDSSGLFGQVVETSAFASRVLLITDRRHAVPVRVLRNDVRAIAVGDGEGSLLLKDVAITLDIREGDRLVSSGLGGRFPSGYPVGVVESVGRDPAEPFADILVRPSAALDRARQVLVVFANDAASEAAELAIGLQGSDDAASEQAAEAPAELDEGGEESSG